MAGVGEGDRGLGVVVGMVVVPGRRSGVGVGAGVIVGDGVGGHGLGGVAGGVVGVADSGRDRVGVVAVDVVVGDEEGGWGVDVGDAAGGAGEATVATVAGAGGAGAVITDRPPLPVVPDGMGPGAEGVGTTPVR